jgi:photosystem II stability/assembly factor-like uncharacterized protein
MKKNTHERRILTQLIFLILLCSTAPAQGWQSQSNPFPLWGFDVFFIDGNRGWVVGNSGVILNTTNGGTKWNIQSGVSAEQLLHIEFIDTLNGFVAGVDTSGGILYRTIDGGNTWNVVAAIPRSYYLRPIEDVKFSTRSKGLAVGIDRTVLKTTDGGTTWQTMLNGVDFDDLVGLSYGDSLTAWAVSEPRGLIIHSGDQGLTWTVQDTGAYHYHGVQFVSTQKGWVTGGNGVIRSTSDGGQSWMSESTNTTSDLHGVSFVDSLNGWVVGWDGVILHTVDGGINWQRQESGTLLRLWGVHFFDETTGWVVGQDGIILHTSNGGITFIQSETSDLPRKFTLLQNYPNPFNPVTTIIFDLPERSFAELKIFNAVGQEVATLLNGEITAGRHEVAWDATAFPSGIYLCRFRAGTFTATKKLLMLR